MEYESYLLMVFAFEEMGLEDYIDMEYDWTSKTAVVRCIIDDEAAES